MSKVDDLDTSPDRNYEIEKILKKHEEIKELRNELVREKNNFRKTIYKAFWTMLKEKEKTEIKENLIIQESKIVDKINSREAGLERLTSLPEKLELKEICEKEYHQVIEKIIEGFKMLNELQFYKNNPSFVNFETEQDKSVRYRILKDEIYTNPNMKRRNEIIIIDIKDNKEKVLKKADMIKEVQEKVNRKTEHTIKKLREVRKMILDCLGESIIAQEI